MEDGKWLYTVGYFEPFADSLGTRWVPLEDTSREEEARALVNYLNGGEGRPFQYITQRLGYGSEE
jgi:hypothetical protein